MVDSSDVESTGIDDCVEIEVVVGLNSELVVSSVEIGSLVVSVKALFVVVVATVVVVEVVVIVSRLVEVVVEIRTKSLICGDSKKYNSEA